MFERGSHDAAVEFHHAPPHSNWISWKNEKRKRKKQLKLATLHKYVVDRQSKAYKCACVRVWKRMEKVDHSTWIKHKWTCTQCRKNRIKVNHLRLVTSALTRTTANRIGHIQPTNIRTIVFHFSGAFVWMWPSIRYANNLNSVFESLDSSTRIDAAAASPIVLVVPDSNFNIQLVDINAHTTHSTANEQSSTKQKKHTHTIECAEYDGRWSMPGMPQPGIVNIDVWIEYLWECECGRPRDLNITFVFFFFSFNSTFNFSHRSDCKIQYRNRAFHFFVSQRTSCFFRGHRAIFICTGRMTKKAIEMKILLFSSFRWNASRTTRT